MICTIEAVNCAILHNCKCGSSLVFCGDNAQTHQFAVQIRDVCDVASLILANYGKNLYKSTNQKLINVFKMGHIIIYPLLLNVVYRGKRQVHPRTGHERPRGGVEV